VHTKVLEGDNKQETTRGASLRELQHFFEKEDSNKGYAGLRRIADEDGTAVWTILEESEVTAKLDERTKERRQEERRRDDLFSAQARAHSGTRGAEWKEAEARLRAELKAEMIATALEEQASPSGVGPGAVIDGRQNTRYIGGIGPGRGDEYGSAEEGVGGEDGNQLQQVLVASNEMQLQMNQMQEDLTAALKRDGGNCTCTIG